MKALIVAGAALSLAPVFLSAGIPAPSVEETAIRNARDLARQHNAAGAEAQLVLANDAQPNSADWHVQAAQRLMWLAHDTPQQTAVTDVSPQLAASALQHLRQADALTQDAQKKANIKTLIGLLQERYFGDHAAALASYQAAVQLAPDHPQAKRRADRLQRMEAHTAEKLQAKGGAR